MDEQESLVATRARRSNAGSRLKQLIEQEQQGLIDTSQFITEDDDNVNLLFQEDEQDEEFIEEEEDDEEQEEGEQDDEKEGEEQVEDDDDEEEEDESRKRHLETTDQDDIFSDSDISGSDSDESEGEKELQRQERIKKRQLKKQKRIIPPIIKTHASPKKPKRTPLITSDSLLLSQRRASSRSAAVESKQALIEKLKESEQRRAKYLARGTRVKQKHHELTQQERLDQALETEKQNIESLMQFRQQEIVKKERQRLLLLSRRIKLHNIIRLVSKEVFIYPNDEVKQARKEFEKNLKGRRKLGKKKLEELNLDFPPFEIDQDLPLAKQEREKREEEERIRREEEVKIRKEQEEQENVRKEQEGDIVGENLQENPSMQGEEKNEESNEQNVSEITNASATMEVDNPQQNEENKFELIEQQDFSEIKVEEDLSMNATTNDISESTETKFEQDILADTTKGVSESTETKEEDLVMDTEDTSESTIKVVEKIEEQMQEITTSSEQEQSSEIIAGSSEIIQEDSKDEIAIENDLPAGKDQQIEEKPSVDPDQATKEKPFEPDQELKEDTTIKRVKFADEIEIEETPNLIEPTPTIETPVESKSEETFEGPPQRVCQNMLYFLDFNEDKRELRLNPTNLKSILFGKQSLLPASRRFKEVKTILHIGKVEPYAAVKKESDDLFEPASDLTEDNPIFEELKKLPRLGIKQDIVETVTEDIEQESTEINIETQAPTGLYLPNGNKKNCMISGTEVKYFDPSTGIPYSSVETYKLLKLIEQGLIPWVSLTPENNDTGVVEIYLGSRENSRHAAGVPEGFDG